MADSINNKAKEYYDNDNTGGSLNNNLKDFLKQQGAEGNSLNTLWRNYAYGEGGNSLNTRLGKLWGTSGSLIKRWKDVLGLTWDDLKLFFNARRNDPELLLSGATSFDGTDDYIQLASDGRTDFANQSFTISAWVKFDDVSTHRTIYSYDHTAHSAPHYANHFRLDSNATMTFAWNNGSSAQSIATTATYSANIWYHMAVTFTSGSQKIYVDGSVVASGTSTDTITYYDQEVWIGKNNFGGYMDGSIANVGIWNRALSASEIESIYWRGQYADLKGTELTNLVSWYNLKDTGYGSDIIPTSFSGGNQSLVDGVLTVNSSATYGANTQVTQNLKYRLTYTIATIDSGSVNVSFSTGSNQGTDRTTTGTYTEELTVTGNSTWYFKYSSFTGTITNIVLNEVISPDSTGTNNGSIYGATTLTDAYSASSPFLPRIQDKASDTVANYGEIYGGNAVSFDGINDYATLNDATFMNGASAFTISAWALHDNTGSDVIFTTDSELFLGYNAGKVTASYRETDNTRNRKITTNAVDSSKWYHIVATWDKATDGEIKLYINGDSVAQSYNDGGASTASVIKNGTSARIGAWVAGSQEMDGLVSHLKILNVSVTQDQVRELYTKPELTLPTGVASSALKLDMPMQEGSGVAILDGSGNQNHGTGNGITWATGQEYGFQHPLVRSNNPMVFDGDDDYIDTGNTFQSTFRDSFSFSAWIYLDDGDDSSSRHLMGSRETGSEDWIMIRLVSGVIQFYYASNNNGKYAKTNSAVFSNGATGWHHVVGVANNSTNQLSIYLNGSQQTLGSGADDGDISSITMADFTTTRNLFIGARNNIGSASEFFDGMMSGTNIFNTALSATEVSELYAIDKRSSISGHSKFSNCVGSWLMGAGTGDTTSTIQDQTSNNNDATVSGANLIGYNDGTVSGSPASIIVPEGLNEGRDSQGYYLTDTDSISSGIRFKGAEYINVQDSESLDFANAFTIETWIKPKQKNVYQIFLQKGTGTKSPRLNIAETNGQYTLDIVIGGSHNYVNSTNDAVIVDQWQHLVVTWNGSTGKMYIDGSQNATASISGTQDLNTDPLTIGKSSSSYFTGSLDEVKLYSKELSATEVLKNYNNGKSAHSN